MKINLITFHICSRSGTSLRTRTYGLKGGLDFAVLLQGTSGLEQVMVVLNALSQMKAKSLGAASIPTAKGCGW